VDEPILAVDFGTSESSAILVDRTGDHQLTDGLTRESWPTSVCWRDGEMWVGEDAENRKAADPSAYRNQFKRVLRDTAPILLGNREFTSSFLVSSLLRVMRERAPKQHPSGVGREVRRAVLTVPPSYLELGDRRAGFMTQAGLDAGFTSVELLPEPVAAGLAAPEGVFPAGSFVLVYDFGGGTFDAALVRIGEMGSEHRIPAVSIDGCGGTDIDASIMHWLLEGGQPRLGKRITPWMRTGADLAGLADLLELAGCCHRLKTTGFAHFRSEIDLTLPPEQLRELARPWVEMTIRCCRDLLHAEDVAAERLDGILLVGGSSQLPLVGETLRREFPCRVVAVPRAQLAVVTGAARFARGSAAREGRELARGVADRPVRWAIPGDARSAGGQHGRLVRWRVGPGDAYLRGQELAEVRLALGSLYRLRAGAPGVVRTLHASPGQTVRTGDWLLTAAPQAQTWRAGRGLTDTHDIVGTQPAVGDDLVFHGTDDGIVEARAVATGELCWRRHVGSRVTAPISLFGTVLYVGCSDGRLYTLKALTGERLDPWPLAQLGGAVRTAPVFVGPWLLVGGDDDRLCAVLPPWGSASAPQTRYWQRRELRRPLGARINHPLVVAGSIAYALVGDALHTIRPGGPPTEQLSVTPHLTHISVADGDGVRPVGEEGTRRSGPPPLARIKHFAIARDATLYACCQDDVLRSFNIIEDRHLASYPPEPGDYPSRGLPTWARKPFTRAKPLFSTAPAHDGARGLYAGTRDGRVAALDARTLTPLGLREDETDFRQVADAAITGVAVRGQIVYAGSADGRLYALDAATLAERWRYDAQAAVASVPVVTEGSVLVTTDDGRLHAVDAVAGPREL
jgi:outer membrane protein assembly factor BamB/actin-like ATPase involved in cell morphogenesis